jgi:hypothetical protein
MALSQNGLAFGTLIHSSTSRRLGKIEKVDPYDDLGLQDIHQRAPWLSSATF